MSHSLHIAIVQAQVRPDCVDEFRAATEVNARESRREAGVIRFDVIQELEDPTRFVLIEVFRDPAAANSHRETAHYQHWRDTVAPLMAEPRTNKKYVNVSPEDAGW
jgi:autoinducer 2-degrading protein